MGTFDEWGESMRRTNVYLDDDQLRALKHLAAEERASVAVLVRRAVDRFLVERLAQDDDWGERFDALVSRIQARMPADVTSDEIEADITAAREEVRRARHAERSR